MDGSLKRFLSGFLDMASAKLATSNEPQTAESLAELVVELVTKALTNPQTKFELANVLRPYVQEWLEKGD